MLKWQFFEAAVSMPINTEKKTAKSGEFKREMYIQGGSNMTGTICV